MTDVLFVARGRPGLGHVTPLVAIAKKLPKDIESKFISYDNGSDLLDRLGIENYRIEGPVLGQRKCPWLELLEIEDQMSGIIEKEKPRLVVVDGEYYLPLFCRSKGIKNVVLTTTNYVEGLVGPYKKYFDSIKILFDHADFVLVHGIREPRTRIKSFFIGPVVGNIDENMENLKREIKKDADIVITVTKGGGELEHILNKEKYIEDSNTIIEVCKKSQEKLNLNARFLYFSGFGSRIEGSTGFVPNLLNYFAISDVVIARAGLITVEELVYLSKPSIFIVPTGDEEKLANAKDSKNLGFADFITIDKMTEENLIEKINILLSRRDDIKKLPRMKNGADIASQKITEFFM